MTADWEEKNLGEVLALEYGKPLPPNERSATGKYAVYGANGVKDRSDKFYSDRRSIIVGRKGSAGEITLTEERFWPLDVTYFVTFDETKYDLQFLYYLLSLQDLTKLAKGVKPGINRNEVYSKMVRVPALSEQQRIVAILGEAFAGLALASANAEKNLKNARELFESQLSRVFRKIARKSGSQRLAEIVTRLTNGYVGPTRNIYLEKGVPYLLARHVRDNQLEFDGKTFVSDEFNEKNSKSKLKTGDVLLVQSGHIGHSAVVGPNHEGHNCHAMIVITPVLDKLTGDFLSFYFGSPEMKSKFEEIRSGSTVPHLTCGLVRELMIPLPTVDEQRKIVTALKELEQSSTRLASATNEKIMRLGQLKQSILQKAFSGELTSPPSQAIKEAAE
ncbi:MAG: restriction endonuclease subunit S [Xanthobacteraceae bacterium]|nr:restriction endonuclease subunit S [Xanthobacteraceae bacterium]